MARRLAGAISFGAVLLFGAIVARASGRAEHLRPLGRTWQPRIGRFALNVHELGGFRVPVSVRRSNVAGCGVFLDVSLPEGALVWEFNQTVGLSFGSTLAECVAVVDRMALDADERHYVANHGYGYKRIDGVVLWRLANDRSLPTSWRPSALALR